MCNVAMKVTGEGYDTDLAFMLAVAECAVGCWCSAAILLAIRSGHEVPHARTVEAEVKSGIPVFMTQAFGSNFLNRTKQKIRTESSAHPSQTLFVLEICKPVWWHPHPPPRFMQLEILNALVRYNNDVRKLLRPDRINIRPCGGMLLNIISRC